MERKKFSTLIFSFLLSSAALSSASHFSLTQNQQLVGAGNDDSGGGIEEEGGNVRPVFVFGDSYADTGNLPISVSRSWKRPYGTTFPGQPSGRFSDGRVLTDYLASFYGVRAPSAYQLIKNFNTKSVVQNGINFAHGGTGVFQTLVDLPTMSTQIDFFQQLIDKSVFSNRDLSSSIALVSLAGNDYGAYLAKNGNFQGIEGFSRSVVDQLMVNIRRLHNFGIRKIVVTGIGPLGCLPQATASNSYQSCNAKLNNFSVSHNQMLEQNIWKLNYEAAAPVFTYLDLYTSFISALGVDRNSPGDVTNKLRPCCDGDCGAVDKNGKKKYAVCENPGRSIFWDSIHPSNSGWNAIFSALNKSFYSLMQ